jgi:hypothetical protein
VRDSNLERFGEKESLGADVWSAQGPLELATAAATKFSAVGGRLLSVSRRTPDRKRDNHPGMVSAEFKHCSASAGVASDVRDYEQTHGPPYVLIQARHKQIT